MICCNKLWLEHSMFSHLIVPWFWQMGCLPITVFTPLHILVKLPSFPENRLLSWVGRGIRRVKIMPFTAKTCHKKNFKVCNSDHLIKSRLYNSSVTKFDEIRSSWIEVFSSDMVGVKLFVLILKINNYNYLQNLILLILKDLAKSMLHSAGQTAIFISSSDQTTTVTMRIFLVSIQATLDLSATIGRASLPP